MPSAPASRTAPEAMPPNQGPQAAVRPGERSKTWSIVVWLPVIATVILAIFAVVQAYGKMH